MTSPHRASREDHPSGRQPIQGIGGAVEESDRDQIVERLGWTPRQRLAYLLDILAFEERAHRARPRA